MGVGELVRLCASAQVRKCLCTCGRGRGCFARADLDVRVFTNWHSVTASILAAAASAATTPGARPTVVGVDVGGVLVAMVEGQVDTYVLCVCVCVCVCVGCVCWVCVCWVCGCVLGVWVCV